MKIIEVETNRGDSLFGCWYGEKFRDVCVIITNGTGGSIFENKFLRIMGDELEKEGVSYIYAHNSGAFQMIDLPSKTGRRSGLCFEMFDDCVEDLQAYVDFAKTQGYRKIVLGGHSYGCNKVVYYLHKSGCEGVDKFVLISPTDTQERTDGEKNSADVIEKLAQEYVEQGKSDQIIPILYDDYNFYTAQSFNDAIHNKHHYNLPVYNDKSGFGQLQNIKIDGLFVMGQYDVFAKGDAKNHLEIIKKYSDNPLNQIKVIENTGHTFKQHEIELSRVIIDFAKE